MVGRMLCPLDSDWLAYWRATSRRFQDWLRYHGALQASSLAVLTLPLHARALCPYHRKEEKKSKRRSEILAMLILPEA